MKFESSISILFTAFVGLFGIAEAHNGIVHNPQQTFSTDEPCLAKCTTVNDIETCEFEVRRDDLSSELGYFEFKGENGDCGGTNPTLGIKYNTTYIFVQKSTGVYYHPLGFSYYPDGALDDKDELQPDIAPPASGSDCVDTLSCPAPMYCCDGKYLGEYSNNADISPIKGDANFGLDDYEPAFFLPLLDWKAKDFSIALKFDVKMDQDIFYFCHIHQYMTGRIKFIDNEGQSNTPENKPIIPYPYQEPDAYDRSCGATGISAFQLPNDQCPTKFVCEKRGKKDAKVSKFAECIDTMNCAMVAGMTTRVNNDNAVALFNHQMIPHHQQAVNMCKAFDIAGGTKCEDIFNEGDAKCVMKVLCAELINVQNAQIQTMRGVLASISADPEDDCVVRNCSDEKNYKFKNKHKNRDYCRRVLRKIRQDGTKEQLQEKCGERDNKNGKKKVSEFCPRTCKTCKPVKNDEDDHGCNSGSTGYEWCAVLNECVRPWETPCVPPPNYCMNDQDCPVGYWCDTVGFFCKQFAQTPLETPGGPTPAPTETFFPTSLPTWSPTATLGPTPSVIPTSAPTNKPTASPTLDPTTTFVSPTLDPTTTFVSPTLDPTTTFVPIAAFAPTFNPSTTFDPTTTFVPIAAFAPTFNPSTTFDPTTTLSPTKMHQQH